MSVVLTCFHSVYSWINRALINFACKIFSVAIVRERERDRSWGREEEWIRAAQRGHTKRDVMRGWNYNYSIIIIVPRERYALAELKCSIHRRAITVAFLSTDTAAPMKNSSKRKEIAGGNSRHSAESCTNSHYAKHVLANRKRKRKQQQ